MMAKMLHRLRTTFLLLKLYRVTIHKSKEYEAILGLRRSLSEAMKME